MADPVTDPGEAGTSRPCPICGKPGRRAHRPFCSPRCADVDLHRWLAEGYRVPGDEGSALDEEDGEAG